jgi:hypothetical protein
MRKRILSFFSSIFWVCSIQSQIDTGFIIRMQNNETGLITAKIQHAIDSCASAGGGVVRFPEGRYVSGALQLKSNVTLHFDKGAVLQGSDNFLDYGKGEWENGLITGDSLINIRIEGEGLIDGVNCYNPNGEEGFRGPHCIRLTNCVTIIIQGITIINAANWAINCRQCSDAKIEQVSIRGGHDGLHTRFCRNFTVTGCDFRTGDDAFAGCDNRDFRVVDCNINTSCNGFRFGCLNFTVKNCRIRGPGEYEHRISHRTNMLAAFVHFSPEDENPKELSGNWLIQDVTISNVDCVYNYNYENGLWQTGQPVTTLVFENIKAVGILSSFSMAGDQNKSLRLIIRNADFSFQEGSGEYASVFEGVKAASSAFFNARNFDILELHNVTFHHNGKMPVLQCISGNKVWLDQVKSLPASELPPYKLENIGTIINEQP